MKQFMLSTVCAFVLILTSCGSDDDGGNSNCRSCGTGIVSIELCDNGDGTYSVNGEGNVDIPEGTTFDEIVTASCAAINAQ